MIFKEQQVLGPGELSEEQAQQLQQVTPIGMPDMDTYIPWLDDKPTEEKKPLFKEVEAEVPITREIHFVIDADSLVYKAGYVGARDYPEEHANTGGLFKEVTRSVLDNQIDILNNMISGITRDASEHLKKKGVGIHTVTLLITPREEMRDRLGLAPNFRYALVDKYNEAEQELYDIMNSRLAEDEKPFTYTPIPAYKAGRKNMTPPPNIAEMMDYLYDVKRVNGLDVQTIAADGCEADDLAYGMKVDAVEDVVLAVIDKDILYGTPSGEIGHFNFNSRELVHTADDEANLFYYRQCIVGDSSDGIKGLYRCGKVAAEKTLPEWTSHEDAWARTLELFMSKNSSERYAMLMMRLVNLGQIGTDGEIHLWEPPHSEDFKKTKNTNSAKNLHKFS